ncbi:MAG: FG-GAP repeat protein [Chlorobi bacterium OLB7]|nr:MAG: FG-GAP repeat protein [Chlorobi bacterium OLB7]
MPVASCFHGFTALERPGARTPLPSCRTRATPRCSIYGDGALDIAVGCIGSMSPTDAPVGTVGLLINDGAMNFKGKVILDSVGRIADVQPGDLDGDGDTDFSVADFGYLNRGGIGWLEQTKPGEFRYHSLTRKAGAINVPLADLNRDGRLDIVAVTAQEHEEVAVFLNGKKGFKETIIAKAPTPSYGSSGIQLVDMDRDGDLDILYSNGDNLDLPTIVVRPYHGVQWLENKGKLKFVAHDLLRYYGAYRAEATDLDGDGDTDVVASSLFNDWSDPHRASLIWLENNGKQKFTGHGIATAPTHLLTIAIGDLNNDRLPDIVGGGMHPVPPVRPAGPRHPLAECWLQQQARKAIKAFAPCRAPSILHPSLFDSWIIRSHSSW